VNLFVLASVLLLCVALGLRLARRRKAWLDAGVAWPFCARKPLASPQQVLYQRLVMALPGHTILFQVPVSGVLGVKVGVDFATWNQRIRRLYFDFVVCAKDATVLAAIELQDDARSGPEASSAERIKERASADAGIRVIRWQAKALPDHAAIQKLFFGMQMPFFDEAGSSANQSWWPSIADVPRRPPLS
jgi:hypothetical protein